MTWELSRMTRQESVNDDGRPIGLRASKGSSLKES